MELAQRGTKFHGNSRDTLCSYRLSFSATAARHSCRPVRTVSIKLWDIEHGNLRFTFRGHTSAVKSLAFSADEKLLASGGRDGTVRLWRMATEEDVKAAGWYERPAENDLGTR